MSLEPQLALERRRRSRFRLVLVGLMQVACIGFVARSLWINRAELAALPPVGIGAVLALFVLNAVGHLQRTVEFTYMLRKLGVKEPFGSGFLLTGAGLLLNHLPLNAGFIMRAMVLRRDHQLPYSAYVSLTMVNALINLGVGAATGVVGLSLFVPSSPTADSVRVALAVIVLGCAAAMHVHLLPRPQGSGFIVRQYLAMVRGVSMIRGNGAAIAVMASIATTKILALALRFAICFALLGRPVPTITLVLVAAVQSVMAIVNITPGNLGLREIVVSVMSGQLGTSETIGLAAAGIDRVFSITYAVVVGLPGLHSLRARGGSSVESDSGASR